MCSINGCVDFMTPEKIRREEIEAAGASMRQRGPDGVGGFFAPGVGFFHNRLAVMDPEGGAQPMSVSFGGNRFVIVYNGEIYNSAKLRADLAIKGATFRTDCDTETVLWCYAVYGERCPELLNGIFAFAIYSENEEKVFLCRDRLGVKPLYYSESGSSFYFSSEVKGLLARKDTPALIDRKGLWQLLYLSPVTLPGSSVFCGISELLPGYCATVTRSGFCCRPYWQLKAEPCHDSPKEAAAHVRELFCDAVKRQLQSDVPLAVLLSGGLDSSAVTAVAAREIGAAGGTLSTYSFEYEGNRENFKSSLFQPQGDDAYAAWLAEELGTAHTVLTAPTSEVVKCLYPAVYARDLPGQADIDSSLLYFCRQIKKNHTVVLSGECSDEIFGGYPWFYRPEMLYREFFPWLHDPSLRIGLFDDSIMHAAEGLEYLREACRTSRAACPFLPEDNEAMRVSREATWLSTRYFMTNLLERKDRMSMAAAVEVRVPFADHRILEYVFNVPWEIKFEGGVEKALLRRAMTGYLPDRILYRKKSPYPKTHHPKYEEMVRRELSVRLSRPGGFLSEVLDRKRLAVLLDGNDETWFGQLMARPQLLAWLCQLDYFFEVYHAEIR